MARKSLVGYRIRDGTVAVNRYQRVGLGVAMLALLFAGWRIWGQMQAERWALETPERALAWRAQDPIALQQLTERALQQKDPVAAVVTARQLLADAPLTGEAYRDLGFAAEQRGDLPQASRLLHLAERRVPRDLPTRAWLAQEALRLGDATQAMRQFDLILRQNPSRFGKLAPLMVQMAKAPAAAKALVTVLGAHPPWRAGMLQLLQDPKQGDAQVQATVMQHLQATGGLSTDEYGRWLDSLMAQGRWGEAYARWAGSVAKPGGSLALLYNGDFAQPPGTLGFDWRLQSVPGVLLTIEPAASPRSPAAHLRFLDRGVPSAGLDHPLMLMPGRYRLDLRLRAQAFQSELGLYWVLDCNQGPRILLLELPSTGSFDWREMSGTFEIPAQGCEGQWLRLINPVTGGGGQRVAGELWLAGMRLHTR